MQRLCTGYAQVMQRSRLFFKCGCFCDKTLFFSYLLAPFFYAQVPCYKCYIIALEFFLCIGYAQVMQGSRFFFKCGSCAINAVPFLFTRPKFLYV